jgi:hypothetical protein
MKTCIISLLFMTVFFVNCKENAVQPVNDQVRENATAPTQALGVVPSDIGLHDIVLNPSQHNWNDLDVFYKKVVLSHQGKHYFNNLKKMTISHLVNDFSMLKYADVATIEFYIDEQRTLDLVDPIVFRNSLLKMRDVWKDEDIHAMAGSEYKRAMDFINREFNPNDDFFQTKVKEFEHLKLLSERFPSRWGD